MMDFWKSQFDKIYIGMFTVGAGAFLLHILHHSPDSANINQAWGVLTFFMGLLSGLITGRQIGKSESEKPLSILPENHQVPANQNGGTNAPTP